MEDVWRRGEVVKDWKDAEVVPIPKKGDLRKCDNWRAACWMLLGKSLRRSYKTGCWW